MNLLHIGRKYIHLPSSRWAYVYTLKRRKDSERDFSIYIDDNGSLTLEKLLVLLPEKMLNEDCRVSADLPSGFIIPVLLVKSSKFLLPYISFLERIEKQSSSPYPPVHLVFVHQFSPIKEQALKYWQFQNKVEYFFRTKVDRKNLSNTIYSGKELLNTSQTFSLNWEEGLTNETPV